MRASRHELTFDPGAPPERLDRFLARMLPERSREQLKGLILDGHVTIGGAATSPSQKLRGGERIEVVIPEAVPVEIPAEDVALDICYEDSDLLVVDKPRGMLTHPAGPRDPTGSLVNALLAHCDDLGGIHGELRPGIVHRLDRDTSGLLVVAKNDLVQHRLSKQFQDREVDKQYFALAHGQVSPRAGRLEWPIGRHPVVRNKMRVDENRGRPALTEYRAIAVYAHATLLLVRLHTGRTHQIRVHFARLGHPLIGDVLYGSRREAEIFAGVALHSTRLGFRHPRTGERLCFHRPVPEDMRELIERARLGERLSY